MSTTQSLQLQFRAVQLSQANQNARKRSLGNNSVIAHISLVCTVIHSYFYGWCSNLLNDHMLSMIVQPDGNFRGEAKLSTERVDINYAFYWILWCGSMSVRSYTWSRLVGQRRRRSRQRRNSAHCMLFLLRRRGQDPIQRQDLCRLNAFEERQSSLG